MLGEWRRIFAWAVLAVPWWGGAAPAPCGPEFRWEPGTSRAGGAKGFVELRDGDLLATRSAGGPGGSQVICSRSRDGGLSWETLGVIARDPNPGIDIGDGHLCELRDGRILYSYRHNRRRGDGAGMAHYQIRVAESRDGGAHWTGHSTVEEVDAREGEARGLWSSFLHETGDGRLQCYYDDENAAWRAGFRRHQWLLMKAWDDAAGAWGSPVVVSRARDPRHLSRDGMPSVVELPDGELLCALESVATERPHPNVIRLVRSDDGGRTWNWSTGGREIVYRPERPGYSAVSPWMARLGIRHLVCVFATDEGRDAPDRPGERVAAMNRDIKYVASTDAGRTWGCIAFTVYEETHRAYMPQLVGLRHPRHDGAVICLFLDTRNGPLGRRGWLGSGAGDAVRAF